MAHIDEVHSGVSAAFGEHAPLVALIHNPPALSCTVPAAVQIGCIGTNNSEPADQVENPECSCWQTVFAYLRRMVGKVHRSSLPNGRKAGMGPETVMAERSKAAAKCDWPREREMRLILLSTFPAIEIQRKVYSVLNGSRSPVIDPATCRARDSNWFRDDPPDRPNGMIARGAGHTRQMSKIALNACKVSSHVLGEEPYRAPIVLPRSTKHWECAAGTGRRQRRG